MPIADHLQILNALRLNGDKTMSWSYKIVKIFELFAKFLTTVFMRNNCALYCAF